MLAARIHEHGGPEVIRVEDIPTPEPAAGEVAVKVLGVSVNHLDLWVRRGMPGFPVPFPRILGCDGAGAVLDAGGDLNLGIIFEPRFLAPIIGLAVLACIPIVYKKIKGRKDVQSS